MVKSTWFISICLPMNLLSPLKCTNLICWGFSSQISSLEGHRRKEYVPMRWVLCVICGTSVLRSLCLVFSAESHFLLLWYVGSGGWVLGRCSATWNLLLPLAFGLCVWLNGSRIFHTVSPLIACWLVASSCHVSICISYLLGSCFIWNLWWGGTSLMLS